MLPDRYAAPLRESSAADSPWVKPRISPLGLPVRLRRPGQASPSHWLQVNNIHFVDYFDDDPALARDAGPCANRLGARAEKSQRSTSRKWRASTIPGRETLRLP